MVRLLIEEMELPVIVDAGLGRPSEAAEVMELGGAAGRKAWLAGPGRILEGAEESSPLTGFLGA